MQRVTDLFKNTVLRSITFENVWSRCLPHENVRISKNLRSIRKSINQAAICTKTLFQLANLLESIYIKKPGLLKHATRCWATGVTALASGERIDGDAFLSVSCCGGLNSKAEHYLLWGTELLRRGSVVMKDALWFQWLPAASGVLPSHRCQGRLRGMLLFLR